VRKLYAAIDLVAIVAVALVGCSGDDGTTLTSPASLGDQSRSSVKSIGPSEIVLCLDVSDGVAQEELQAVVAALTAGLADPELIPQDGTIAVAALVYGDTSAAALDTFAAVTPASLDGAIEPALEGLLTDRLVTTATADLAAALTAALPYLDPGSVADRHVLIVGSGAAADVVAAEAASAALANAGVMISAVALGADDAAAATFRACAEPSGGFVGLGGDDLAGVCGDALAYMLQVDLDLEPEIANRLRGEEHTVMATLYRGAVLGDLPVVGQDVTIAVVGGPNQGATATAGTDTNGIVTFTYTGVGGAGTDLIVATSSHPGTGVALADSVTVTWANAVPVCDAGGPYLAAVDADTARVILDGSLSADADGDTLSFLWSVGCGEAAFDDPTAIMPELVLSGACLCVDSLLVDLMVTDGIDTSTCQAVVRVDDNRPPVIEVREDPLVLWPPNHKTVEVTPDMMIVTAEDACGRPIDLEAVSVVEVRSDEPEDAVGEGDGHTDLDIVVDCPKTVRVRAERAGGGNGRVYTIVYRFATESGETLDVEAQVAVPHDASSDEAVEDAGAGYAVEPGCDETD